MIFTSTTEYYSKIKDVNNISMNIYTFTYTLTVTMATEERWKLKIDDMLYDGKQIVSIVQT